MSVLDYFKHFPCFLLQRGTSQIPPANTKKKSRRCKLTLTEAEKLKLYGLLCFQFIDSKSWEAEVEDFCQNRKR